LNCFLPFCLSYRTSLIPLVESYSRAPTGYLMRNTPHGSQGKGGFAPFSWVRHLNTQLYPLQITRWLVCLFCFVLFFGLRTFYLFFSGYRYHKSLIRSQGVITFLPLSGDWHLFKTYQKIAVYLLIKGTRVQIHIFPHWLNADLLVFFISMLFF